MKLPDPDVYVAQLKADLGVPKGDFWMRKVIYMAGMKSFIACLREEYGVATETTEALSDMLASDLQLDLQNEFPDRNIVELVKEMVRDVNKMIDGLIAFDEEHSADE